MFRIIFQLMILIYIILVVYNILNLQKYNINGFIFDTDNIEVVKENIQKLNPVDFYKENNFNIFNPQYNYIQDITNYKSHNPTFVFKNDELFKNITDFNHILDTNVFNESHFHFPIRRSLSIISGKNSIPLKKCIHNHNIIGVLDGEATIYLFNPKHKDEIIEKENYQIKKWGHKKKIEKGTILLIPPYWSYIQEIESGIIQYHMDIDTYFTFIPNYLKETYL